MKNKKCSKCNIVKQINQFYKSQKEKDGLTYLCKDCLKKYGTAYYQKHKEKIKKHCQNYYQDNKHKAKLCQQNYRKNNQDKIKASKRKYIQTPNGKYSKYKGDAKWMGREWNLSFKQFITFWQKDCYYCGAQIKTIGLDRMDYHKGYIINNVCSCCKNCNFLKGIIESKNIHLKGLDKILKTVQSYK